MSEGLRLFCKVRVHLHVFCEGDLTPVRAYVGDAGIELSAVQTEIFADP